jgi:hypothetical protein
MRNLIEKFPDGFEGFEDPDGKIQEPLMGTHDNFAGETLASLEKNGEIRVHNSEEQVSVISSDVNKEERNPVGVSV